MGVGRADKEQKKGEGAKGKRPGRQKGVKSGEVRHTHEAGKGFLAAAGN